MCPFASWSSASWFQREEKDSKNKKKKSHHLLYIYIPNIHTHTNTRAHAYAHHQGAHTQTSKFEQQKQRLPTYFTKLPPKCDTIPGKSENSNRVKGKHHSKVVVVAVESLNSWESECERVREVNPLSSARGVAWWWITQSVYSNITIELVGGISCIFFHRCLLNLRRTENRRDTNSQANIGFSFTRNVRFDLKIFSRAL